MPCALAPAYGVTSMPFRPGCHRPFHHSVVLRSYASAVIVVARFSIRLDFFIRFCHPLDIMLSTSSRQPSSLSGPSPRISTAGAYCWQSIITPLCLGGSQVRTPDGVLRKVRDSNPRAISDSRVSGAVLSASQPTFLVLCLAIPSQGLYPTTALHLRSSISPDANSR